MESWLESFAATNFRRSSDTAHDLKTPLNVAVLNLELMRMRIAKLAGADDEKINAYAKSIEIELRRMARIFDTFFLLSTPPKNDGDPQDVDLCALCTEIARDENVELAGVDGTFPLRAHPVRIRQAVKMFFEGASRVLQPDGRSASVERTPGQFAVTMSGKPSAEDFELTRIFKFYYTDPQGNPDLSLAAARLIAETYGGALSAVEERDKVTLRLSFPGE
jgi:nitrogen fixation/metabolism regulation signal transduction histidine kinase